MDQQAYSVAVEEGVGCNVTPSLYSDYAKPERIIRSNNLIKHSGSAYIAKGSYIFVTGKILDKFCMPIPDVSVAIWQADSAGKYPEDYVLATEWDIMDADFDSQFKFSGRVVTDALGQFGFITVLPGGYEDRGPHINFYVTHPDFEALQTKMFFDKHPRNKNDIDLLEIGSGAKELVMGRLVPTRFAKFKGVRQYDHTIVLDGTNFYRQF